MMEGMKTVKRVRYCGRVSEPRGGGALNRAEEEVSGKNGFALDWYALHCKEESWECGF